MAIQIEAPFDMFNGLDGKPLSNGKIYIGQVGTDPTVIANQIPVFWDEAMTIPAAQPLRTNAGYIVRNGSPSRVYVGTDYSMSVSNSSDVLVYYIAEFGAFDYASKEDLIDLSNSLQLPDYSALRSYDGDRQAVYITGYQSPERPRGISGVFISSPNSFEMDNGGTTIVSSNGVRWARQYSGPIEVDWFGAYGADDSKQAIQAAIAVAEASPGGQSVAFRAGATYTLLSGLVYNSCKVGFIGRGATINFPQAGTLFTPNQFGISQDQAVGQAKMHPIQGFRFVGPGFAVSAGRAIYIGSPIDQPGVNAGNTIRDCVFQRFAVDIHFSRGSFFTTVENCNFQGVSGAGQDTVAGIIVESAENSGERNTFRDCIFGARYLGFSFENPNASTYFYDCSFDYFATNVMAIFAGVVSIIGGHTELNHDLDYWYKISGTDSLLIISAGHEIAFGTNKLLFSPFYCDSTCTRGGILVDEIVLLGGNREISTYLVAGSGRTKIANVTSGLSTTSMLTSIYQNMLTYPSFESATFTADWSLSGTVPPNRSTQVTPHSGTYSLRFNPAVANPLQPTATAMVNCKAGDFVAVEFWYLTVNLAGTGSTFGVTAAYTDKAGNLVGTGQQLLVQTTNIGTWTRVRGGLPNAAPAGAQRYQFDAYVSVPTSGAPLCYLDDVVITIA